MGFLDRYFRGEAVSDADYAAQEVEEDEVVQEAPVRKPSPSPAPKKDNVVEFSRPRASAPPDGGYSRGGGTGSTPKESAGYTREFSEPAGGGSGFGGGFSGGGRSSAETAEAYVVFKRLKDFTMASQVADKMIEHKIVILNLESCDDEVARRVLDFIGGVAYACSSMVKRIAGRVFMITPKGVSSDGEFFDEIRNTDHNIRYE